MSARLLAALAALTILLGTAAAGATPRLAFSPARLIFDAGGDRQVVTLQNRGDAPLSLKAVAFSADTAGFSTEPIAPQSLLPGQSLPVAVTYVRAGARAQAFGALLVYSDDPAGFDDPRSEERDQVRGVALVAGETTATLWLWLPPLVAAVMLLAGRRTRLSRLAGALGWLGALSPLLTSLWLLHRFDPGFAVPAGNYGIQLGLHRALWPARGLELWTGVDGLSLPLVLLLAAALLLRLLSPHAGEPVAVRARGTAWWLLLLAGALLALCALDAVFFLAGWELALLGAWGRLSGMLDPRSRGVGRWGWLLPAQLGLLLLAGGLWAVRGHSLPTALADGTTVAHATDLIKLSYANYFGDWVLWRLPVDRLLWVALTLGALLPVVLLPLLPVPVGERLWLSLPLLALGVGGTVRLPLYLFPEATAALGQWLLAAAVTWTLAATLRALRRQTLPQLLVAALAARGGGVFLGLLATSQAGAQAALLQLWHHGLAVVLLALVLPYGSHLGARPRHRACLLAAALLIADAPGGLGFVQRTLLMVGAFPCLRVATVAMTAASFLCSLAALRLIAAAAPSADRARGSSDLGTGALAIGALAFALAVYLGVWTQPLIDLSASFVSDFITHVFSHLDASVIA